MLGSIRDSVYKGLGYSTYITEEVGVKKPNMVGDI